MDLLVSLAIVDELHGGTQTRQLADGWMGRESRTVRRLRTRAARAVVSLAVRLTPAPDALPEPRRDAAPGSAG